MKLGRIISFSALPTGREKSKKRKEVREVDKRFWIAIVLAILGPIVGLLIAQSGYLMLLIWVIALVIALWRNGPKKLDPGGSDSDAHMP